VIVSADFRERCLLEIARWRSHLFAAEGLIPPIHEGSSWIAAPGHVTAVFQRSGAAMTRAATRQRATQARASARIDAAIAAELETLLAARCEIATDLASV
jgi:hypothetical protein